MTAVGINIGYTVLVFECRGGLGVVEVDAREEQGGKEATGPGLSHTKDRLARVWGQFQGRWAWGPDHRHSDEYYALS